MSNAVEEGEDDMCLRSPRSFADEREPRVEFNEHVDMHKPVLAVGTIFSSPQVFTAALKEYAIQHGFDYMFVKNETSRVTTICKSKCGWRIHTSPMQMGEGFQIKSYVPTHKCPRSYQNHQVTSSWLSSKYLEKIRDDPNWNVHAIRKSVKRDFKVDVSKAKIYRAKEEGYVEKDANEQMFPIAYAVVEAELKDSRMSFLTTLLNDIGSVESHGWTFISDRQKGLVETFEDILPNADHRFCVRHMYNNFKAEFKGKILKDTMWSATYATTAIEFQRKMKEMEKLDKNAYAYWKKINPTLWSRSGFSPRSKCNLLEKLEKIKVAPCDCHVEWYGGEEYEVQRYGKQYVVNLAQRCCGCRSWDLTGIPYIHVGAAIFSQKESVEKFAHPYYHTDAFRRSYREMIHLIPRIEQWPRVDMDPIRPPPVRRPSGMPKKLRRMDADEPRRAANPFKLATVDIGGRGRKGGGRGSTFATVEIGGRGTRGGRDRVEETSSRGGGRGGRGRRGGRGGPFGSPRKSSGTQGASTSAVGSTSGAQYSGPYFGTQQSSAPCGK
ncbi:uncharacterized protein LOC143883104 [Tasmannia lanceolata]|uniref:uncharacterized protein LOC143883104 n=1 Tax=Tasmannia lanceolata TaxID=3420 RepID=UPI00406497BA